jgi:hypothetical protein
VSRVRKVENLEIITQNVIPQLAEIPIDNAVMMLAVGAPAIPTSEYTVDEQTIIWNDVVAGYDLEIGEVVVVDYEYDDVYPYDGSDPTMNPVFLSYNLTVAEEDIVPKLIHGPEAATLVVKVNDVVVTEGVDWTRSGKVLTWISGTTLNVGDTIYVEYRRVL